MIKRITRSKRDIAVWEFISTLLLFLAITFFLFYSFANLCFDTLLADPSFPIMIICLIILGADEAVLIYLERKMTPLIVLNIIIIVSIILAWTLNTSWAKFLSLTIFLKFPEVIEFNTILNYRLSTRKKLQKFLVVCKIFYMVLLTAHLIGCIFYFIDHTLIQEQYFGNVWQNPGLYYQGQLACFTPIYALSQGLRYAYCMYYSISLLSTVAYGDIIGKNPIQDIYVMILLFLATIGIGLILEEMIVYFRKEKIKLYFILKKVKYMRFLLSSENDLHQESDKLIRYLIRDKIHEPQRKPNLDRLSWRLKDRILKESIANLPLPAIVMEQLIYHAKSIYFPPSYVLLDNLNNVQPINFYILMDGRLRIGYGEPLFVRRKVSERGFFFGYEEILLKTKSIKPYTRVITEESSMFLGLGTKQLRNSVNFRKKKDKLYYYLLENLQLEREKYLTNEMKKCSICNESEHEAYECHTCHFRPNVFDLRNNQIRNSKFTRLRLSKSTKVKGIVLQRKEEEEEEQKVRGAAKYCRERLEEYMLEFQNSEKENIQKYEFWSNYHKQYNIL